MIEVPWIMIVNGQEVHCGLSWFVNTWSGFIALAGSVVGGIICALFLDKGEK